MKTTGFFINRTFPLPLRFYACFAGQGAGSPLIDRCGTREIEAPYRAGDGFLFRLPFTGHMPTVGLVIGRWRDGGAE